MAPELTPAEVTAAYFDAWVADRIDQVEPLLAEDVDFAGALGTTSGREQTLRGLAGMFRSTRTVRVIKRWVNGPDVLTWFEFETESSGPMAVVNWSHVEHGRITRIRVTFDPRPMLAG